MMTVDSNSERLVEAIPSMTDGQRTEMRRNADRLAAEGPPLQKEAARHIVEALDHHRQSQADALTAHLTSLTVEQRVLEAFRALPPSETDLTVMRALLDHPGSTSAELSQACGWGAQTWHMHFGTMCANRSAYLWPAPRGKDHGKEYFTGIFADLGDGSRWTMRPSVAQALATIGIRKKS